MVTNKCEIQIDYYCHILWLQKNIFWLKKNIYFLKKEKAKNTYALYREY